MKASYTNQLELLELQKLGQKESALLHKRDSYPVYATVCESASRVADLQRAVITQSAVITDMVCGVTRIENEVARVTEHQERQQSRIDNNQMLLRDTSAMEHEIVQMDRRLAKLENDQVEVEERVGTVRAAQDQIKAGTQAIVADIKALKAWFRDGVANSGDELCCVIAARRELADRLLTDLLEEYEDARRRNGAFAVIEVRDGYGIGATANLSLTELERIRLTPAGELYLTEDVVQTVVHTVVNTSY